MSAIDTKKIINRIDKLENKVEENHTLNKTNYDQIKKIKTDLYGDEDTGDIGSVKQSKENDKILTEILTVVKYTKYLISFCVGSGLITFVIYLINGGAK